MSDTKINDGGPAFPAGPNKLPGYASQGISVRDYFAGRALSNPELCPGHAPEWMIAKWFGARTNISRGEIAAKQAYEIADAMLSARSLPQSRAAMTTEADEIVTT